MSELLQNPLSLLDEGVLLYILSFIKEGDRCQFAIVCKWYTKYHNHMQCYKAHLLKCIREIPRYHYHELKNSNGEIQGKIKCASGDDYNRDPSIPYKIYSPYTDTSISVWFVYNANKYIYVSYDFSCQGFYDVIGAQPFK